MARVKRVTREFKLTVGEVLVFDYTNNQTSTTPFEISGEYNDDTELLKQLNKQFSKDNYQPLVIQDKKVVTELRGMLEEDFLRLSHILDLETRKPINEEE